MSLMKEILNYNYPIWDECVATPFVQELRDGTLPFEKFAKFMIQDSVYLKNYARSYGKAIFLSEKLKDIQMYYSILSFVTDTESRLRIQYLKQAGMTDDDIEFIQPLPECKEYIDFLLEISNNGSIQEIIMSVLPCMISYSYVFRKIAPDAGNSRYYDFIEDYAMDEYARCCELWSDFADEKCNGFSETEQKKLMDIFTRASELELKFWQMAYKE